MSKDVLQTFNPGGQRSELLWTPDQDGFVYPDAVLEVSDQFNKHIPYEVLVARANERVVRKRQTGIEYGEWRQAGDSTTDAIGMFSTFASRIDTNMALRGEFCDMVFREMGITDSEGNPLPFFYFGAPAGPARYPLSREERRVTAAGDLGPAALSQLEVIKHQGFGRMALLGHSQGGSMAAAAARVAGEADLDVLSIGAASVPNVKERGKLALQVAFAMQGKHLRPDLKAGGINAFIRVHEEEYSELKYAKAMFSQLPLNWALFNAMTHDTFGADLEAALSNSPGLRATLSAATGQHDGVGLEPETRGVLEDLRHDARERGTPLPHFVSVKGGNHSWGDRVKILASFYGYAIARGMS